MWQPTSSSIGWQKKLNEYLEQFYVVLRKTDSTDYKKSSFIAMRHNLNRSLKEIDSSIDIIHDMNFVSANQVFNGKLQQLKENGKGSVKHFDPINEQDLQKMANMECNTPVKL